MRDVPPLQDKALHKPHRKITFSLQNVCLSSANAFHQYRQSSTALVLMLVSSFALLSCSSEDTTTPPQPKTVAPSMTISTANWSAADQVLAVGGTYDWGSAPSNNAAIDIVLSDSDQSSSVLGTTSISAPDTAWNISVTSPAPIPCTVIATSANIVSTRAVDNAIPDCQARINEAPVAKISPALDQSITVGDSIVFSGASSSDPDDNLPLTYAWSFSGANSSSTSTLANPGAMSFTTVDNITVTLVVSDSKGLASTPVSINVSVVAVGANLPPVATINSNPPSIADSITVETGASINFSGDSSVDPDGNTPLTYAWSFTGANTNSTSTLANPGTMSFASVDTVTVTLVVSDSTGLPSAPTSIAVNVVAPAVNQQPTASINSIPAAIAGTITIDSGASIDFSSTASDLDGNTPLTYLWSFDGGTPAIASIANPGSVTFNQAGSYQVSLVVTDSLLLDSAPVNVTVKVNAPVINQAPDGTIVSTPAADSSGSITINATADVTFSATATDPDKDSVTFSWAFNGGTPSATSGAGPITVNYPMASPASQPYTVTLTATDNVGNVDLTPATLNISVLPVGGDATKTITFVEINDLHAHLTLHADLKRITSGPSAGTAVPVMRGGLARIATKIKDIRTDNPDSIVMNIGDTFHGGVEAFYSAGNDIVKVMNAIDAGAGLGIDVGVPGNWDFSYGPSVTRARFALTPPTIAPTFTIDKPTYPNLAANLTSTLPFQPATMLLPTWSTSLNGVNIGIIGITSDIVPYMHPNLATGMTFEQGETAYKNLVNKWSKILRDGNATTPPADIVVVMSELGIHKDKRLADIITTNSVDVFFSAHTHELTETALTSVSHALVVEPGNDTYIGRMDIGLDNNNKVVSRNWQVIPIEQTITAEPTIATIISAVRAPYLANNVNLSYPNTNNIFTISNQTLTSPIDTVLATTSEIFARDRSLENSFNNLYTDMLLQAFSSQGAQVAMTPGFRFGSVVPGLGSTYEDSSVATGNITIEDVYRFIPVPYTLSMGNITGKNLKFVIDKNLRDVYSTDVFQHQGGWFDGFAGLQIDLNLAQPSQPIENIDGSIGTGTRLKQLSYSSTTLPVLETDSIKVVGCTRPYDTNTATTLCSYNNFTGVTPIANANSSGSLTAIDFLTDALKNNTNLPAPRSNITDTNNTLFWPMDIFIQPIAGIPAP